MDMHKINLFSSFTQRIQRELGWLKPKTSLPVHYGIIGDIHGNAEALRTVLNEFRNVDCIVCLGDIVGYGPNPNECANLIKEKNIQTIAGNHDKAVIGEMSLDWFTDTARAALRWTIGQLTDENFQYLRTLPLTLEFTDFQIVHGSLLKPLEEYINSLEEAVPSLEVMSKSLLFVGHSHQPFCAVKKGISYNCWRLREGEIINVSEYDRLIINPGAVGQPRDEDPRASFGVYDSEAKTFTLHRIPYDIRAVQEKMAGHYLPEILIDRLTSGL